MDIIENFIHILSENNQQFELEVGGRLCSRKKNVRTEQVDVRGPSAAVLDTPVAPGQTVNTACGASCTWEMQASFGGSGGSSLWDPQE